jgi:UDPglucose 6-dehydrogenase
MELTTASVIGLGKLGAPMAAAIASKGLYVIGVDVDVRKVEALSSGQPPVFEPGLTDLLQAAKGRLTATSDLSAAVLASDVTFIVVPTPSEPDGGFSLKYVLQACEGIGVGLATKNGFHLVVLTSTVMPGSTGGPVREALEETSGKRCGEDFGLCYSPEFIALGSVIRDFLNPDLILIGESDPQSGTLLEQLYRRICENNPPVARMNFVNAELTKLAVNTFVTTKISFANMLARICERLPGGDVDVVTRALGMDSRIGPKYLKGAVGYGGPCFPHDNLALIALADQLGVSATIAEATHKFNRSQVDWLADRLKEYLSPDGKVGILGLTYKPHTDVVEEAFGLMLAAKLADRGYTVVAYDPAGLGNAQRILGSRVRFVEAAEQCIAEADVVVVATPWPLFRELPAETWGRHSPPRVVIDCWRILGHLAGHAHVAHIPLGVFGGLAAQAD